MKRPFSRRTISSPFGARVVPGTVYTHHHTGTDYAVPEGSAVRAIADGTVIAKRWHPQLGNTLTLGHENGRRSKYMHLRHPATPKVGAAIKEGEIVAEVGNTGTASRGAHLHLEAWEGRVCVDPETWF
mgnify:CR=1 FL=1